MRSPSLQSFFIAHHCFNSVSMNRSGKFLRFGFTTNQNRHSEIIFGNLAVNFENAAGFLFSFFWCRVGGVAFLPEKFGRSQKKAGTHFPADDIRPLIDQYR